MDLLFTKPRFIYHLLEQGLWRGNETSYLPPTHEADGFIHCASVATNLIPIANRFYKAKADTFLCLVIDSAKFTDGVHVKWEPPAAVGNIKSAQSASSLLPHVFGGPFTPGSVVKELAVERGLDGEFLSIEGVPPTSCDAVVWDCDGTLIDTEPLWVKTETEVFTSLGMAFEPRDGEETTGLRIDVVVQHWMDKRGWADMDKPGRTAADVTARILDLMEQRILSEGKPMPGVSEAIELCKRVGVKMAVASSSPHRLIEASLKALGIRDAFEVVASAEEEAHGKPHPGVYMTAAAKLGVAPTRCLAVEDSLNGVLSAKAARMRVIAVPETPARPFGVAEVVLGSLEQFDELAFHAACSLG